MRPEGVRTSSYGPQGITEVRHSAWSEITLQMNLRKVFKRDLVPRTVKKNNSGERYRRSGPRVRLEWNEVVREGNSVSNI